MGEQQRGWGVSGAVDQLREWGRSFQGRGLILADALAADPPGSRPPAQTGQLRPGSAIRQRLLACAAADQVHGGLDDRHSSLRLGVGLGAGVG